MVTPPSEDARSPRLDGLKSESLSLKVYPEACSGAGESNVTTLPAGELVSALAAGAAVLGLESGVPDASILRLRSNSTKSDMYHTYGLVISKALALTMTARALLTVFPWLLFCGSRVDRGSR